MCLKIILFLVMMQDASERAKMMLSWDILNGVSPCHSKLPKLVWCDLLILYNWHIDNNKAAVAIASKYLKCQHDLV